MFSCPGVMCSSSRHPLPSVSFLPPHEWDILLACSSCLFVFSVLLVSCVALALGPCMMQWFLAGLPWIDSSVEWSLVVPRIATKALFKKCTKLLIVMNMSCVSCVWKSPIMSAFVPFTPKDLIGLPGWRPLSGRRHCPPQFLLRLVQLQILPSHLGKSQLWHQKLIPDHHQFGWFQLISQGREQLAYQWEPLPSLLLQSWDLFKCIFHPPHNGPWTDCNILKNNYRF